jgi:preprotein translocase subunit SecY
MVVDPYSLPETALALTAGSMFVMWLSELITERGIGNGAVAINFRQYRCGSAHYLG